MSVARAQEKALISANLPTHIPLPPQVPRGADGAHHNMTRAFAITRGGMSPSSEKTTTDQGKKRTHVKQKKKKKKKADDDDDMIYLDDDEGSDGDIFCDIPLFDDDDMTGRNDACELACAPLVLSCESVYVSTTTRAHICMFPTMAARQEIIIHQTLPASAVSAQTVFRCAGNTYNPIKFAPYEPIPGENFSRRYNLSYEHADGKMAASLFYRTVQMPPEWTHLILDKMHSKVHVTSAHNFEALCRHITQTNNSENVPSLIVVGGFTDVLIELIRAQSVHLRRDLGRHRVPQNMQALVQFALARIFNPKKECILYVCQEFPICIAPINLMAVETALRACMLTGRIARWRWKAFRTESVLKNVPNNTINDCTTYLHRYLSVFYPKATGADAFLRTKKIILTDQPLHELFSPTEFRHAECDGSTIVTFNGPWNDAAHYTLKIPVDHPSYVRAQNAAFARETDTWKQRLKNMFSGKRGHGVSNDVSIANAMASSVKMRAWEWQKAMHGDVDSEMAETSVPQQTSGDSSIVVVTLQSRTPSRWWRHPHAYVACLPWLTRDFTPMSPYVVV